jgi:hypothetical protein
MKPPTRRERAQVLGVAVVVAVICWYFGVNVLHALMLGAAITVIGFACLIVSFAPQTSDLRWRGRRPAGSRGSRSDVANLSGALKGSWGLVGRTGERRLWQLARRRLALEGLDLQNPGHREAIEARIGRPMYRTLLRTGKGGLRMPMLNRCLDTLDALNPTYYPEPPLSPERPWLRLIPRRTRER